MQEIFKSINGYEGLYEVSNFGRVKSLKRYVLCKDGKTKVIKERILKQRLCTTGDYHVFLCKNGTNKTTKVQQLVDIAFLDHKR